MDNLAQGLGLRDQYSKTKPVKYMYYIVLETLSATICYPYNTIYNAITNLLDQSNILPKYAVCSYSIVHVYSFDPPTQHTCTVYMYNKSTHTVHMHIHTLSLCSTYCVQNMYMYLYMSVCLIKDILWVLLPDELVNLSVGGGL